MTADEASVETLAYRIRVQMSHCRDAVKNHRKPPPKFSAFADVLDLIRLDSPLRGGGAGEITRTDTADDSNDEGVVVMPPPSRKSVPVVDVSDEESEDLKKLLFSTPTKSRPKVANISPPKQALADNVTINDDEIDALLSSGVQAPTTEDYNRWRQANKGKTGKKKKQAKSKAKSKEKKQG